MKSIERLYCKKWNYFVTIQHFNLFLAPGSRRPLNPDPKHWLFQYRSLSYPAGGLVGSVLLFSDVDQLFGEDCRSLHRIPG